VPASAHDRRRQVASMLQFDAEASAGSKRSI
jgi:hypothetical protein